MYDSATGSPLGTIADPDPGFAGFGAAVALRGDVAVIGDVSTPLFGFNDGTAHLFDVSDGHLIRTLAPNPTPGGDGFGFSVALPGATIVAGAPGAEQVTILEGLRVADASPLGTLEHLEFLSLSDNRLDGVGPLVDLGELRSLHLDGNQIGDISALVGQQVVDDGDAGYSEQVPSAADAGWIGNVAPTPGALDFDYRVHAGVSGSPSALARWDFTALVPGTYEVFATWPHHESRADDAPYTVVTQVAGSQGGFTEESSTVRINQKFAPGGAVAAGRPWQSLGVYSTAGTMLRVELGNDADGLVAADAIRVVPVDPITRLPLTARPGLAVLDVRRNPLDDASHDLIVPQLVARDLADPGFVFRFDADARPQWVTTLESQSVAQGGPLTLFLSATDPDAGDPILYTATSDNAAVSTSVAGNKVTLTPAANFSGTARITLGAHDGPGAPGDWRGRSVEQTLLLSVGLGTVTGTVWQDLDGDGSRDAGDAGRGAVEVFLDLNGNGALDRPATPTATTPWFPVDHLAGGSHVGDAVSGQIAFDASGRLYVSDGQTDHVHRWDPVLGRFVQFTANGANQEARGPRAIAFGIDGDLYVASSFDTNVRRFNGTTGAFVEELWPDGAVLVSDRGIMAASPDRRILYIADFNPAAGAPVQIVRYDTQTHALLTSFSVARVAGVFAEPSDIAIGPDGHIYVADRTLGSVMRISGLDGTPLPAPGQTGAVFVGPGTGTIGANPRIAFDPAGNLHVASDLGGVARFSRITGLLLGTAATGLNDFTSADIAFDSLGRLYRSVGGTRISVSLQGEPVALTDAGGQYVFGGLEPGTYAVTERVPADSIQTFDLGLSPVAPIAIFPDGASDPAGFTRFNNALYFSAFDETFGRELWRFDGRTATRVTDLAPGAADSEPLGLMVFGGALYFTATDGGTSGFELWRYDGAAATRVTDIAPGTADSLPTDLTIFNNALYFVATDGFGAGQTGRELWRYDGTSVARVADINPGISSSAPSSLTVFNSALYFAAANATVGRELFRYDGSSVSVVANINPGAANSSPANLTVLGNNILLFTATDPTIGTSFGASTALP